MTLTGFFLSATPASRLVRLVMILALLLVMAQARIKDIADVEGIRDNQLVGYGLVVGLNGTGDSLRTTRPSPGRA